MAACEARGGMAAVSEGTSGDGSEMGCNDIAAAVEPGESPRISVPMSMWR